MISPVTDQAEILSCYELIKAIPYVDMTPETVLAKCLTGEYEVVVDCQDEPSGIAISTKQGTTCFVVGVYAKNNVKFNMEEYIELLKSVGYTKIRAVSTKPELAYSRLLKMNKLWTVFERDI